MGGYGWTWVVAVAVEARHRGSTGRPHSLLADGKELLPLLLTTALEDDRRYW
jgi:hypothetical protein